MARHTTSQELEGATPVPAPETTPPPAHQKARARKGAPEATEPVAASDPESATVEIEIPTPKPSRKAKLKSGTAVSDSQLDYAALGLDPEKAKVAEGLRLESLELGRKSTGTVFEWGRIVAELRGLAEDQDHFAKLARGVLKLSRTGAENYQRVYQRLAPHQERLVRVGMIASGLYDLATAEPEQVEEVLAAREAGQELTGAEIKAILGKGGASAASPDDGGPEGLKAAIADKLAFASNLFCNTLFEMTRSVHILLEPHRNGIGVHKGKAEAILMHPARLACGLLESLLYAAQVPGGRVPAGVIHVLPVTENRWVQLRRVLDQMGSSETWPKADKVSRWLIDTVLPEYEWALGNAKAEKARVVIEELDKAREAERVRVRKFIARGMAKQEKAKEKAKLEQKKAREKAKREKLKAKKRSARGANAAAKVPAVITATMAEATPSSLPIPNEA